MDDKLKRINFAPRITVCLDSAEGGITRGRFYSAYFSEPFEFTGMADMLMRINMVFDELEFPRMTCELRNLLPNSDRKEWESTQKPREQYHSEQALGGFKGEYATFFIQVLFRQNATWQGEFCWIEGHCSGRFRSVLELMGLMSEAIEERGKNK